VLKGRGINTNVVCTGNTRDLRSPNHFGDLLTHSHALGVGDLFKILGVVPYAEAQALMHNAVAVINPSYFEGWSTTVEEAKTLQKKLLLSDIAVHREQAPKYGLFFDPDDTEALANLMESCLKSPSSASTRLQVQSAYELRTSSFAKAYLQIINSVTS
jgi:glycosyltransferase involved in cell wall biosynthesis